MPYETYVAYQQAEAAFRALYFGRPLETLPARPPHLKLRNASGNGPPSAA